MPADQPAYQLHLFLVRLWPERVDGDQVEWRGEVKYTHTGEVRYFRHGPSLYAALLALLESAPPDTAQDPAT
jgi:hypothetical protein